MILHFCSSLLRLFLSWGSADVSTTVVETFLGVPMVGGMVI